MWVCRNVGGDEHVGVARVYALYWPPSNYPEGRKMKRKPVRRLFCQMVALLGVGSLLLAGCGQKGPLYHPEEGPPDKADNRTADQPLSQYT